MRRLKVAAVVVRSPPLMARSPAKVTLPSSLKVAKGTPASWMTKSPVLSALTVRSNAASEMLVEASKFKVSSIWAKSTVSSGELFAIQDKTPEPSVERISPKPPSALGNV